MSANASSRCLIVDDDSDGARALEQLVRARGWEVRSVFSLAEARRTLETGERPDMMLLDLNLPDGSGLDLLSADRALCQRCRVVLVTAHASIASAIEALRLGAVDYLIKPLDADRLGVLLARHNKRNRTAVVPAEAAVPQAGAARFGPLIGATACMAELYRSIARVAPSDASVLITGESGTGKGLVARAITQFSRRHDKPFLAVKCGAISPGLIESELFGHLRGSFTGAIRDHSGLFQRAHGGTLFLDEICEMPLELQTKLLRVLEVGAFLPLGADEGRCADVRIIAATNCDPRTAMAEGRMREDLFYRLNVFPLQVPPLRARMDDVPLLASTFLEELSRESPSPSRFTADAMQQLGSHDWPGNVRELRNVVIRAHVMADDSFIGPDVLSLVRVPSPPMAGVPRPKAQPAGSMLRMPEPPPEERIMQVPADPPAGIPGRDATEEGSVRDADMTGDTLRLAFEIGTDLADIERQVILATLARFGGYRERTAAALGVSLKTLYNRLREYEAPRGRRGRTPGQGALAAPIRCSETSTAPTGTPNDFACHRPPSGQTDAAFDAPCRDPWADAPR